MSDVMDYTEVPHLQEVLNYLPIFPEDEEDVVSYISNISNLITVNYKYDQYQFAYFGVHLLYMIYIYCTAWKISRIEPDRYKDAIVFARAYSGREKDLKIEDAESIFVYSLMPEKDIAKLFKIINLDRSHILAVSDLVDTRNEMAHASGKFEILTEDIFEAKANSVIISMKNIQQCFGPFIQKWYKKMLIGFCAGEYEDYDNPNDIISEQMIQSFKLSTNDLIICNKTGVNSLIAEHPDFKEKLKDFKKAMQLYCEKRGYI